MISISPNDVEEFKQNNVQYLKKLLKYKDNDEYEEKIHSFIKIIDVAELNKTKKELQDYLMKNPPSQDNDNIDKDLEKIKNKLNEYVEA